MVKKGKRKHSLKNKKNEDREFQLEMLKTQILSNSFNSSFTVIIAVGFSWIAAMVSLAYIPDIGQEAKLSVISSAANMIIVIMVVVVIIIAFSYVYMPRRLDKLHGKFIEKKRQDTRKRPSR